MHRHGYKGRKFHRERDQRSALIKGLADSLVKYESIETTLMKAKEVVPYVEKLITKAKKGDLHNRRMVLSGLQTVESAHKLVDQIAPKLGARNSGHLRIVKTTARRGDNTLMARISFVDELNEAPVAKAATPVAAAKTEEAAAVEAEIVTKIAAAPEAKPAKVAKKPAAKKEKA